MNKEILAILMNDLPKLGVTKTAEKLSSLIQVDKLTEEIFNKYECTGAYIDGAKRVEYKHFDKVARENIVRELKAEARKQVIEEYTEWLRWNIGAGGASVVPVENPVIWKEQYLKEEE
jgi:hypothetical protein